MCFPVVVKGLLKIFGKSVESNDYKKYLKLVPLPNKLSICEFLSTFQAFTQVAANKHSCLKSALLPWICNKFAIKSWKAYIYRVPKIMRKHRGIKLRKHWAAIFSHLKSHGTVIPRCDWQYWNPLKQEQREAHTPSFTEDEFTRSPVVAQW